MTNIIFNLGTTRTHTKINPLLPNGNNNYLIVKISFKKRRDHGKNSYERLIGIFSYKNNYFENDNLLSHNNNYYENDNLQNHKNNYYKNDNLLRH